MEYGINVVNYYKIKQNGDSLTQLTWNAPNDSATFTSNAVWSEDGRSIFAAGTLNGQYGLLEIAADGSTFADHIPTAAGGLIHYITGTMPTRLSIGIEERNAPQVIIAPNPTRNHVTVQWTTDITSPRDLRLYDGLGQQVWSGRQLSGRSITIDLSSHPPGAYVLRMDTPERAPAMQRVVIVD
ncbi:MAG: T9SS type A sorting domain-containing protein [Flavobacteriales bacterium]|nr:T9SS type A sorting domain-containing protein [Flavobacteriales bacterium]